MKSTLPCLALMCISLTIPCAAQSDQPSGVVSPTALRALADQLFKQSKSIHHRHPSKEEQAYSDSVQARLNAAETAGEEALTHGYFSAAESHFRDAINARPSADDYCKLGETIAGQGRAVEAIEAYRKGIYEAPDYGMGHSVPTAEEVLEAQQGKPKMHLCQQPESWMKYALLLSQTNQQVEAIRIYQKAFPVVPGITERTITRFPDASTLAPRGFQASVHIALGLCATFGGGSDKAMTEFAKARQLEPASSLTNYYYEYGWQRLAPAVRAKYGTPQQAKAALQKAVKMGKGDVKLAAAKALKSFS